MDFYDRASEWAEARLKDINDTAETLARNVDAETVKSSVKNGLSLVPQAIRLYSAELGELAEQVKAAIDPVIDEFVEYVVAVWDLFRDNPEIKADPQAQMSEQRGQDAQEIAALKKEFEAEHDELVGKLDKMADKYFENHPDLDTDQRTDAEGTFKTIKDDAVEALKADQGIRLAEREAVQQGVRSDLEARRKELEEARDERT